jgi:hypothetical protein
MDDTSLRVDSEEGGNKTSNEVCDVIVICRHRLAFRLWHVLANFEGKYTGHPLQ